MNNIKWLRKEFDYTQDEVADYIGISRVSYNQLEQEKRKVSAMELLKLSDMFSIDMRSLLIAPLKTIQAQYEQKTNIDETKHYLNL